MSDSVAAWDFDRVGCLKLKFAHNHEWDVRSAWGVYRRGVPSRHPHREPRTLGREAPAHHDPRAHAERASPIRLLDAGASAGRRREDRSIHGRAVRSDYADKASS